MSRIPVIAIDGPAASGKSSTAQAVAQALGAVHLDSGSLYRALTAVALETPVDDTAGLLRRAEERGLGLVRKDGGIVPVLDGTPAEPLLRTGAVDARVSAVSALPEIRAWVNQRLRAAVAEAGSDTWAHQRRLVVLDGRDIGSIVFPDAPVKVFLTATPEARAERRLRQSGTTPSPALVARMADELAERDRQDRARAVAPLRQPADAVLLDTTLLGFEEQVQTIVDLVRSRLSPG